MHKQNDYIAKPRVFKFTTMQTSKNTTSIVQSYRHCQQNPKTCLSFAVAHHLMFGLSIKKIKVDK